MKRNLIKKIKEEDLCVYCGENKFENKEKHIAELVGFLQKKVEESLAIIREY